MNRKNTILIAVIINAGLLALLLVAALTMQEDLPIESHVAKSEPIELQLPQFDDALKGQEIAALTLSEPAKSLEEPAFVHKLPQLADPGPVLELPQSIPTPAPEPQPVVQSPPMLAPIQVNEVVVKKGDSLEKIAKVHHTTVDEIIKLNQLPSTFLRIGQMLKIPSERSLPRVSEKKTLANSPEYYTMKVGENPWAIAQKYHMKVEELLKLNGLNEEKARKLKPGDRLRIR